MSLYKYIYDWENPRNHPSRYFSAPYFILSKFRYRRTEMAASIYDMHIYYKDNKHIYYKDNKHTNIDITKKYNAAVFADNNIGSIYENGHFDNIEEAKNFIDSILHNRGYKIITPQLEILL
jgi:hypothetical protein